MPLISVRCVATTLLTATVAIGCADAASAQPRRAPARVAPQPLATPVSPQAKASLNKLKTVLQGLGYSANLSRGYAGSLLVIAPGKAQYKLDFTPSADGTLIFITIAFIETPAAMNRLNYVEVLKRNNIGANFFSMTPGYLIANRVVSINEISPTALKSAISSVVAFADQTSNLWSGSLN